MPTTTMRRLVGIEKRLLFYLTVLAAVSVFFCAATCLGGRIEERDGKTIIHVTLFDLLSVVPPGAMSRVSISVPVSAAQVTAVSRPQSGASVMA